MEVFPNEYQNMELTRSEKLFVRYSDMGENYGFLLLHVNPAMLGNEMLNVVITTKGILFLRFFESFNKLEMFSTVMTAYKFGLLQETMDIISSKLLSNKAVVDSDKLLLFSVNFVCVFPNIKSDSIAIMELPAELMSFVKDNCIFSDTLSKMRVAFESIVNSYLQTSFIPVSTNPIVISDNNISSIMQRIAPEYTTVRVGKIENEETKAGADNQLLVVDENDIAVKAFLLEPDQVNIINKINKGDQLILACAGSGKSVLLIAKCFKAARMNPDKKFLITCYNRNLQSLYSWFIDRAGLKERNVECITFHKLCKRILLKHHVLVSQNIDDWPGAVSARLKLGINDRYYGIFIDEVQMFEQEWYKLCYDLLENNQSDDHLFVICGDKTQKIKNQQKHGKAPWNAGKGYPNYRGGNKNIRIEKNYRNCIQINEYINRFVTNAKAYINSLQENTDIDPDLFLRGKAVSNGVGVKIKKLKTQSNQAEAREIIESINEIHDNNKIPYDEIAIVVFNKQFRKRIPGWQDYKYNIETPLLANLCNEGIPFSVMYLRNSEYASRYGCDGGVSIISTESVLGLDFRAVIFCGLKPLGFYDRTKSLEGSRLPEDDEETIIHVKENISNLYVACTRAKEVLHIIQPEDGGDSVYMKILEESV